MGPNANTAESIQPYKSDESALDAALARTQSSEAQYLSLHMARSDAKEVLCKKDRSHVLVAVREDQRAWTQLQNAFNTLPSVAPNNSSKWLSTE